MVNSLTYRKPVYILQKSEGIISTALARYILLVQQNSAPAVVLDDSVML